MITIAVIAVIGILLLQVSGAIPQGSVGGSMTIGFAMIAAALAVGIHEAWTMKRGVLGWLVNLVVSFIGAIVAATVGGPIVAIIFSVFTPGTSLAAAGGGIFGSRWPA